MSDVTVKVSGTRVYICGEQQTGEIFVPPGWTIHTYDLPKDMPEWNIPPITIEMDEEQAKEIRETIAKNLRYRQAVMDQAEKGY